MNPQYRYRIWLTFFLAFIITLGQGLFYPVLAIGPGTGGSKIRVNEETHGPYILLIATSPLPVTAEQQMSVWVRVTDKESELLLRDAVVKVEAMPRVGGELLVAEATHKNAGNDYDYVAHFDIEKAGQWDITVTVEDELGQVDVSFTETISKGVTATIIIGLAIPFTVIIFVVGLYMWRRSAASQT